MNHDVKSWREESRSYWTKDLREESWDSIANESAKAEAKGRGSPSKASPAQRTRSTPSREWAELRTEGELGGSWRTDGSPFYSKYSFQHRSGVIKWQILHSLWDFVGFSLEIIFTNIYYQLLCASPLRHHWSEF